MFKLIAGLFGGVWGYVACAAVAAGIAIGACQHIDALAYGKTIDGLKLAAKTKEAIDVTASLNQLQKFINAMHAADQNYSDALKQINDQFAALDKDWKNATAKPLPIDCKPDLGRMRQLTAAVAAANQAIANPHN